MTTPTDAISEIRKRVEARRSQDWSYSSLETVEADVDTLLRAYDEAVEGERDAERRFAAMLEVERALREEVDRLKQASWKGQWPQDLLEAMRHYEVYHMRPSECPYSAVPKECTARATLTRYGLL